MNLNILHISDSHLFSLTGNREEFRRDNKGPANRYYNISKRMRLFFTKKEGNNNLLMLKDAMKGKSIDHLIFSGDLTQTSNYEEFSMGKFALKELRDDLKCRFSIIPGNHDIIPNKNRINFYNFFPVPQNCYIQAFKDYGYCIIGIDSTSFFNRMRGPVSAIEYATIRSKGTITNSQIDWLRTTIKHPYYKDLYKIILLHHHPITHRNDTFIRNIALPRIRNSRSFVSFLQEVNINMVLYGHKHPKTACYKKIGNTHFVLAPSIRDGLYSRLRIKGGGLSIRTHTL